MENYRIRFDNNEQYKKLLTYIGCLSGDGVRIRLLSRQTTWKSGYLLLYRTKILTIGEYMVVVLEDLSHVNRYVDNIITEYLLETPFVRFDSPSDYYINNRRKTIENIINHNND